jgi:hypothetical protein
VQLKAGKNSMSLDLSNATPNTLKETSRRDSAEMERRTRLDCANTHASAVVRNRQ